MEILDKLLLDLNESVVRSELDPVPIVANICGVSLKNYAVTEEVLFASRLFSNNLHEVSLMSYFKRTTFSDDKEVVRSRIDLCKFIGLYLKKLKLQLVFGRNGNSSGEVIVGLFTSYGLHILQVMIEVVKKENANELRSAALIPVKNLLRLYKCIDKDRLEDAFTSESVKLDEVYSLLLQILQFGKSKISKGLKSIILSSLGHLVHCFSTATETTDNIVTIARESVYLLKNSFDEKKPEFAIASAALSCVDRCLSYFDTEVFEQIKSNELWEILLKCVSSAQQEDVYRYTLAAKALRLISHHTTLMRKEIARYSQVSYDVLVKCYKCDKVKIDKHSEDALTSFLNELVLCIRADETQAPTQSDVLDSSVVGTIDKLCASYLASLSSYRSSTREFALAITGLTAISPCISLMEEVYKVGLEKYQFCTATLLQALLYAAKYNVRFSTTVVSITTEMADGRYHATAMNTFRNKILLFQTICAVLNASKTPDIVTEDLKEYLKKESEEILIGYPQLEKNIGVTRFVPVVMRSLVLLLNGLSRRSSLFLLDYLDSLIPVLFRQTLNRDLDAWEMYTRQLYESGEGGDEEADIKETGDSATDKVQLDENLLLNTQVDTYITLWYEILFPKDQCTRLQLSVYGGDFVYHDNVSTKCFDRLMSHLLEVLEKLALSYKVEISVESEIEEASNSYNFMKITPSNLYDQDILINIAEFMEKLIHLTTSKSTVEVVRMRIASWYKLLVPSLVNKSKKYPLIAPLYHLIRVLFSIPFNNALDVALVATDIVLLVQSFISELQQSLVDHSGDILYGILLMILSMPSYIAPTATVMTSIIHSLETGVALDQSVSNLHKYLENDEDQIVLMTKIDSILPLLERYFKTELGCNSLTAPTGVVEAIKNVKDYRNQFKKAKPHNNMSLSFLNANADSVEKQILRFLGRLSNFNQAMVAAKLTGFDSINIGDVPFSDKSLFLRLPFHNDNITLPLMKIYRRVVEICKSPVSHSDGGNGEKDEYQTKLIACEILHAITLIMLGNAATSPSRNKSDYRKFYHSLFPVLIMQSVSSNPSCVEIIEPLLFQITRWFAGPNHVHDDEINELLDALIDGLCATYVNDNLRDQCVKCLELFFTYSLKREESNDAVVGFSQFASAVTSKLQTLLKQNVERSRVGAAMVLSKICQRFYKIERKMISLLYMLLQSLHLDRVESNDAAMMALPCSSYQIITKAINNFTKVISNAIVEAYNNSVDVTSVIGLDNGSKASINEEFPHSLLQLLTWMWGNILCNDMQFRRSCMHCYSTLAPIFYRVACGRSDLRAGIDSVDIREFMKGRQLDVQLLSCLAQRLAHIQSVYISATSNISGRIGNVEEIMRNSVRVIQEFTNIIDSVSWVIKCRYMDCSLFYPDSKKRKYPDNDCADTAMLTNDSNEPANIGPLLFSSCSAFLSYMELVVTRHFVSKYQETKPTLIDFADTLRRVLFLLEVMLDECSSDDQRLFVGMQLRNGEVWSERLHSIILDCVLLQVPDRTEVDDFTFKEFPFVKVVEQLVPYTIHLDCGHTSLLASVKKRLHDIVNKCVGLHDCNPFIGGASSTLGIDSLEFNEIVFFVRVKELFERLVDYYSIVFDRDLCDGMAHAAMKLLKIVTYFPLEATPTQVDYSSSLVQFALIAGAPIISPTMSVSNGSVQVMTSCLHYLLLPGGKGELFYKRYGSILVKRLAAVSSIDNVHTHLSIIANHLANPVIVEFTVVLLDCLVSLDTDKVTLSKVICGLCSIPDDAASKPCVRSDLPHIIIKKLLEIHQKIGSYSDHCVLYELLHSNVIKNFSMRHCSCEELEIYIKYLPHVLYPDCHPDIAIPHKLYHDSVLYRYVEEFMANKFPLDSKGVDLRSDVGKEYTKLFYCMMDALVASKSIMLLKLFFTSLSEGYNHVFMKNGYICGMLKKLVDPKDQNAGDLLYFALSLSISDEFVDGINERMLVNDYVLIPTLKSLDYKDLLNLCIKPMRRLNYSKGVLLDTMNSVTPLIQYLHYILQLSTSTPPRSKYLLESLLLSQSIAFDILAVVYDRIYLQCIKTQLTSVFLGGNIEVQGNELTKKIIELAYSTSKKEFADDINVTITRRLYTAAISCYIIVFCKTQNQERVFNSFIFQQLPWATKGIDNNSEFRDFKTGGDDFRTETIGRPPETQSPGQLDTKERKRKSVQFSQYIQSTALSTIRGGNSQYTSGPLFTELISKKTSLEPVDTQPVFENTVMNDESNVLVPFFDDYTIALELSKVNRQPLMKVMIRLVVRVHNLFEKSDAYTVASMPQWLSSVCSVMESSSHSMNSHIFCIQLLINQPIATMVAKYFPLFVDTFLGCCLRDLLADTALSPDINNDIIPSYNYFLRDIVFTFVDSWASYCSDCFTKNPAMVVKASQFINKLLEVVYDEEVHVSDNNVKSIIKLISVWNIRPEKPLLLDLIPIIVLLQSEAGPTGGAHQKVSSTGSIGVRKRLTAMNFLTLLLTHAKYPLFELRYRSTCRGADVIQALLLNAKYERREIYERACSLCGIILRIVNTDKRETVYIDECASVASELESILETRIKQPKGGLEIAAKSVRCITTEYSLFLTRRLINRFMSSFSNFKETGRYEFLDAIYNSTASIKAQYTDQDFMMLFMPYVTNLLNDLSRVVIRKKYHLPMIQILTLKILIHHSESLSMEFINKLVCAGTSANSSNPGPLMLVLSDICPLEVREPAYDLLLNLIQKNCCINNNVATGSKENFLKKRLIVLVLKGILDADDEGMDMVMAKNSAGNARIGIRAKVLIFFNETYSLNKNPYSRLQLLMTDLYDSTSSFVSHYWVQYAAYLLLLLSLDMASGNYLFTKNLAEDSTFKQYRMNTKVIPHTLKRTQSQFQPLFSLHKHLNTQLSQKGAADTRLSVTQRKFVGTQQVDWDWSQGNMPEMWTSGTQVVDNNTGTMMEVVNKMTPIAASQASVPSMSISQRVSKRLSKYNGRDPSKAPSDNKFAKHSLDYYHSIVGASKNITIYRKYRSGEYPDIRITTEDVIKPLQALLLRDKRLALLVYEELFTELYLNLPNLQEMTAVALRENLKQTLNDSSCHDELTGLYMNCCVRFIKHEIVANNSLGSGEYLNFFTADALDPQQIVESSLKSSNVNLGISLLEECLVYHKIKAIVRQEHQGLVSATWRSVFRLYSHLEEEELLQGVLSSLSHGELSREALQYAHFSKFERALPLYARLCDLEHSSSSAYNQSQDSDEEESASPGDVATVYTGLWEDRFFETSKMLLSWDNIYCKVHELVQQHFSCGAEFPLIDIMSHRIKLSAAQHTSLVKRYVPYYIESLVHKVGVSGFEENFEKLELKEYISRIFTGVTDDSRGSDDSTLNLLLEAAPLELLYGQVLCSSRLNSTELAKCRILIDKIYQGLMLKISTLHPYAIKARINNLLKLQQLVELEDITELLKNRDRPIDGPVACKLLKLWQISTPFWGVSPCAWEKLLIGRLIFMEETKDICDSSNFVCEYVADASRAAISDSNLAAARIFLNQCSEHRRDKAMIRMKEVIVAFEYNLKKIILAGEEPMDGQQLKDLRETSSKMLMYLDKARIQLHGDESRVHVTVPSSRQSAAIQIVRDGIADSYLMTAIWKFTCLRRLQECQSPLDTRMFSHEEIKEAYDNSVRDYSCDNKRGKAHVSLAYYCDQTINSLKHDPKTDTLTSFRESIEYDLIDEYASVSIIGYAKGLALGNSFCRDRIPRLFDLLGKYSHSKGAGYYADVIRKIPAWVFLNCSSHLCGCLNISEQAPFIAQALEKLATEYPNALIYQLSASSHDASASAKLGYCGPNTLAILKNTTMNMFMESLDYISHPELRWNDGLDAVESLASKGSLQEAMALYVDLVRRMRAGRHVGHQIGGYNVKVVNRLEQIIAQEGGCLVGCKSIFVDKDKAIAFLHKVKFPDVMAYSSGKVNILSFSEWLNSFNPSYRIEIPGQYLDDICRPPDIGTHALIQYVGTELLVQPSIRKPKRITFGGSNGQIYHFLVKGGEDLRIDERIQYIVRILNKLTSTKPLTELVDFSATVSSYHGQHNNDQKLCIKTYHVIPVTPRLGMLQWLNNTKNLQCIIEDEMLVDSEFRKRNPSAFYNDDGIDKVFVHALESSKLREHIISTNAGIDVYHREIARETMVACYKQMTSLVPPDFIKRKLNYCCKSAEIFFLMRNEYIRSLSATSVITYLLGIGDRHLGNLLIEMSTGKVISIDFGFNFGAGITEQGVPELIPFRLTPQMQGVMSPLDCNSICHHYMVDYLYKLRQEENIVILRDMLSIFTNDPVDTWADSGAQLRLDNAMSKLKDENPIRVLQSELSRNQYVKKYNSFDQFAAITNVAAGNLKNKCSISEQVDILLKLASDPECLGRSYIGFLGWL